jgi:DNA polymerase III subunit delta
VIFFFYGPNSYAARQQIAKLAAEYEKKTGSNLGLERIDGAKAKPEELSAALQATPFLASSRLVIVEDLGSNSATAAAVEGLVKQVPATTVAVFYDPTVDQRTGYFKILKTVARTVKFEPLTTAKLQQWVVGRAQAHGAEIERPAVGRLLDLAGEDQWRLSQEIAKLATYGSPITTSTVETLVEEGNTETIFNLVEATTAGKVETALRQYRRLRAEGLNEVYMLSMILWQLRNLLLAGTAGKTTPAELAKTAGMSPFVAGKMLSKRHLFTEQQLKSAFLQAVDTDYQIKSGVGAADVLVEQLIYRLASRATV